MPSKIISVIIPVYNVSKYLRRCIDSVLSQTFNDFELILINDGSTDDCQCIIDEYSKRDNRIQVIHKNNEGVSSARNIGIRIARGDYLVFIDSDDFIDGNYLSEIFSRIQDSPDLLRLSSKATSDYIEYVDLHKSDEDSSFFIDNNVKRIRTINKLLDCELGGWEACICAIKRSLIIDNNIFFSENIKYGEDLEFSIKVLLKSNYIKRSSYSGYNYLIRKNSAAHMTKNENRLLDFCNLLYNVYLFNNNTFFEKRFYVLFIKP